nr:MAG TPA: hypothetical protein [Caudoviricetes sp.]
MITRIIFVRKRSFYNTIGYAKKNIVLILRIPVNYLSTYAYDTYLLIAIYIKISAIETILIYIVVYICLQD